MSSVFSLVPLTSFLPQFCFFPFCHLCNFLLPFLPSINLLSSLSHSITYLYSFLLLPFCFPITTSDLHNVLPMLFFSLQSFFFTHHFPFHHSFLTCSTHCHPLLSLCFYLLPILSLDIVFICYLHVFLPMHSFFMFFSLLLILVKFLSTKFLFYSLLSICISTQSILPSIFPSFLSSSFIC